MKKLTLSLFVASILAPTMVPMIASAHQTGDIIVRADNNTQLGLTVGYMVTDNIGVELGV